MDVFDSEDVFNLGLVELNFCVDDLMLSFEDDVESCLVECKGFFDGLLLESC